MLRLFKFMGNALGKTQFMTAYCHYQDGTMEDISDTIKDLNDGYYTIPNVDGNGFNIRTICSSGRTLIESIGSHRCNTVEYYCFEKDFTGNIVNGIQQLSNKAASLFDAIHIPSFSTEEVGRQFYKIKEWPTTFTNCNHSGYTYHFEDDDGFDHSLWGEAKYLDLISAIQGIYENPEQHPYATAAIIATSAIALGVAGLFLYRKFMDTKSEIDLSQSKDEELESDDECEYYDFEENTDPLDDEVVDNLKAGNTCRA